MKNIFAKIILLLLALSMLFGFAACKKDDGKKTPTDTQPPEEETDPYQKDSIPDNINYGEEEVVILYDELRPEEFDPEGASFVEEAVMSRNTKVEQRLNVTLNFTPTTGGYINTGLSPFKATVENDVVGGLNTFDICADYGMTIGSCAVSGLCVNLTDYDIIDFDAPWWASDLSTSATINNKLYFGVGDISTSYLSNMYCMFFNEDLVNDLTLQSPYDMVEMDNWKWEFFMQYCNEIYADLDNVEGKSVGDRYGLTMTHVTGESVFYSGGCQMLELDTDGNLILSETMSNSRASNFYSLTTSFFNDSNNVYVNEKDDDNDGVVNWKDNFLDGNSVFTISQLSFAKAIIDSGSGMKFGVLPLPKYDDNQNYRSACWVGRTLYFISSGSPVAEMAATTFECLASEGYRQVTPVLYEDTYKLRYSKDETSGQMIDLIRASIVFDLAQVYTYSFEDQIPTRMTRALTFGTISGYATEMQNISTAMATYKSGMQQVVQTIYNSYQ
ncbi:MAG: extracellular solute-binding protein [Clostridia bacterium]|nr:extracellular solute-binding protein [Clostridia bacterium]